MKSLQNQYNLISEGKGKKDVFLKEAKRLYPNLLTNSSNFNEAEVILKNKGVISENIVAIPAIGSLKDSSKQDWVNIFKENINEERQLTYNDFVSMVRADMEAGAAPDEYVSDERIKADAKYYYNRYLQGEKVEDMFESINENKTEDELLDIVMRYVKDPDDAFTQTDFIISGDIDEVDDAVRANLERDPDYKAWEKKKTSTLNENKAAESKTSKEVEDINAHGYDNADKKNLDNQIFDQYLNGLYVELKKDPELTMEKAREIVAKNLASDPIYYTKNAAFKVDGIGYTDEAPGLTPKEITGKYKASGYGDLKEQKLRKAIRNIIKEELNMNSSIPNILSDIIDNDLTTDRAEYSYDDLMTSYDLSYPEAKHLHDLILTFNEDDPGVQHLNSIGNGKYEWSDWYDSDSTVISYENGRKL